LRLQVKNNTKIPFFSNSQKILIDLGSSTVKVYSYFLGDLKFILSRSIPFKNDFSPELGISEANKKELFELIDSVKANNSEAIIKIYATALYRKLTSVAKTKFSDEFFQRTGLFFNVIDQDLENFYVSLGLIGKSSFKEPVLIINIGGGSTELVVMYGKEAIERKNLDLGVGVINTQFPSINESTSGVKIEEVIDFISPKLPELENKVGVAFYGGGELTYMQLAKYNLKRNSFFDDADHPFVLKFSDFVKRNGEIFEKVSLEELESLMPENPTWMHGARGCSALAQSICQKYNILNIIPSNSNLINGVIRQEFRYVTLSGSFRKHLDYILNLKDQLVGKEIEVLSPRFTQPKNPRGEFVVFSGEEGLTPLQLERYHLNSIEKSDALIVCDPNGYVGASALMEIGYAHALGKRIIFTEQPEEFMLNIIPAEVGL